MKTIVIQVSCVLLAVALLAGCAEGNSIAGNYNKEKSSLKLTLSKNYAFHLSTGGVGTYAVKGSKISMVNAVCGAAHGSIKEGTLVFPSVSGDDMVGQTFAGKWKKQ